MEKTEIVNILQEVFIEVFKDDILISETTSAVDIARWDSLNHIILIRKIEQRFDIVFSLFDIIEMKSVGDIARAIQSKIV